MNEKMKGNQNWRIRYDDDFKQGALKMIVEQRMRIGEVCGLTWDNIDLDKNIITLNRQIVYLNKKGYFFSTLKTQSSNRKILIDDFLIGELKRRKNKQVGR